MNYPTKPSYTACTRVFRLLFLWLRFIYLSNRKIIGTFHRFFSSYLVSWIVCTFFHLKKSALNISVDASLCCAHEWARVFWFIAIYFRYQKIMNLIFCGFVFSLDSCVKHKWCTAESFQCMNSMPKIVDFDVSSSMHRLFCSCKWSDNSIKFLFDQRLTKMSFYLKPR